MCDELEDYEQALAFKYAYADLSWVKEQDEEVEYWKKLFIDWSEANIYITKLLSGDSSIINNYATYIDQRQDEMTTGLLYILKAANKYRLNVDEILQHFKVRIDDSFNKPNNGGYSRKLALDRQANLMFELAHYFLNKGEFSNGFRFLLTAMKNFRIINSERCILECMALFEKFRSISNSETQDQYQNLLLEGVTDEEQNNYSLSRY